MGRHTSTPVPRRPSPHAVAAPIPFAELRARHAGVVAAGHPSRSAAGGRVGFLTAGAMTLAVATAAGVGLLSAHDKVAANPKLAGGTGQNAAIANHGAGSLPASGPSAASPSAIRTAAAPRPSVTSTAPPARDVKRRIQLPARWTSPLTGGVMTTCFCMRWGKFHDGIDLAAPLGTPIHAPGDGVVVKVGPESGYGETIFIRHANGDVSFYGHMARVFVHVGEKVKTGQVIAPVGNEGFSTGPHLHFGIHRGGIDGLLIDPKPWLAARGVKVG